MKPVEDITKALIVDDEEDIGLMTRIILNKNGLEAGNAYSIREAEKKISKNKFDVVFLDINLPDGSGFDLIPLIREKNRDAGIIMISAFDDVQEMQKADAMMVDSFVKKPFGKKDILMALEKIKRK